MGEGKRREKCVVLRERGRAYIDAADVVRQLGIAAKAVGGRYYPKSSKCYTTSGKGYGRRWQAADRQFNEGRFQRPANCHN